MVIAGPQPAQLTCKAHCGLEASRGSKAKAPEAGAAEGLRRGPGGRGGRAGKAPPGSFWGSEDRCQWRRLVTSQMMASEGRAGPTCVFLNEPL